MANKYQKQLYDARSNYRKWLKKLESQGYVINEELKELPSIPKKITPGSVRRVKALTEKLKQTSVRLEFDEKHPEGKLRNYEQSRNVARARARIYKRSLEKEEQLRRKQQKDQQWYEDTASERETPGYSDIPDYDDPNAIPEPPPPIVDPFEVKSYIDFVFNKLAEDTDDIGTEWIREGLSARQQANVIDAMNTIFSWCNREKESNSEEAYKLAKGIEKAKYEGYYITRDDIYNASTASRWIMNIESFSNGVTVPEEVKEAFEKMRNAGANKGYQTYSPDNAKSEDKAKSEDDHKYYNPDDFELSFDELLDL